MEAFLAFDPHNYPFLVEYNCRFLEVISRIAFKHGIITCDSKEAARKLLSRSEEQELLSNVLVLIFTPFIASLRIVGEEQSSCGLLSGAAPNARIRCVQYMDHVILHVSEAVTPTRGSHQAERTVSSERSLYYFVELMKLAFGSNPMSAKWDESQRNLMVSLHRSWLSSNSSPAYLFEVNAPVDQFQGISGHNPSSFQAMDRLLVSANLKATLTLMLQTVLSKSRLFLKLYGEVPSQALMYVNGKFTCEFSNQSTSRLSKKDLILLQLLVESKCMPKNSGIKRETTGAASSTHDEDDEEVSYFGDTESELEESTESRVRGISRFSQSVMQSISEKTAVPSMTGTSAFLLFAEGWTDGARLPIAVRVIKVTDVIVILLISELSTRFQAKSIHSVIATLIKAVYARHEFKGFDELHEFDKSCSHLKKILERSQTRASKQLIHHLSQLTEADIRKYCSSFAKNEMPVRVDALSSAVCSTLRMHYHENVYLFEKKRMQKVSEMEQVRWQMMSMQSFAQEQTRLYMEYLEVKSKVAMTPEPHAALVPGLRAFVYVDRRINTIVWAVADHRTRAAIAPAVAHAYISLKSGKLRSSFSVNELIGHYFHWFENMRVSETVF